MTSCNINDELEIEKDIISSSMNECFLDCEIDDGGPGGGTLPEWSNYFYVHRGQINKNIYYAESADGVNWTTSQLGLGAQSNRGPSSVLFNNNRFIFYKGNNSANVFFAYKTQLASTWYGNTFINNVSKTKGSVSATVFNNKIFIAYEGENNGNLYLAHSSVGTSGNYTEVLALPASENIEHFSVVTNGSTMYVFWTNTYYINGNYREKIYYRTSTNPTNSNSWSNTVLLEDSLSSVSYEDGISTSFVNGSIYVAYGETDLSSNGTPFRRLTLGKLDQNLYWTKTIYSNVFENRAGVMGTNDSNLLLSYVGRFGGGIKTMKVDLNGTVVTPSSNSGGATHIGGVSSYSKFN